MQLLSRPRRPRRSNEWSTGKAVTFIVTLAATRCVTLAAQSAGMSRKSAYALKARDPVFAEAWSEVLATSPAKRIEGDTQVRAAPSISSTGRRHPNRDYEDAVRDRFFARLRALSAPPGLPAA